ncbi:hypothetical protein [Micromonospora sp. WMMD737]|uniref:hypothetical protein n=1 Tax=Micromonospora sp. WMMD737 TaxID=3404113 RepID=UPI003B92E60C
MPLPERTYSLTTTTARWGSSVAERVKRMSSVICVGSNSPSYRVRKRGPTDVVDSVGYCGSGFTAPANVRSGTSLGFEIDPASATSRNDWIVTNRLAPVAALSTPAGEPLDWPVTHVRLIARRPVNT